MISCKKTHIRPKQRILHHLGCFCRHHSPCCCCGGACAGDDVAPGRGAMSGGGRAQTTVNHCLGLLWGFHLVF